MQINYKIYKTIAIAVFAISAVLIFEYGSAQAKTATDGDFRVTYNDPLFTVSNAAPGETKTSDITVENLVGADKSFQFELDVTATSSKLKDRLFLKIYSLDEVGKEYCEYGCRTDKKISDLDRLEKFVKIIPGDSTGARAKKFRFALTFDPTVDNTFQNLSVGFDMKIGFGDQFQETVGNGAANNGTGTGTGTRTSFFAPLPSLTGTTAEAETGGETQTGQVGKVKGEETAPGIVEGDQISTCQSWPKWVWVLMLIAYFAAFLWWTFENLSDQIEKRDIRWGWQAVLAAAAFLVWYFFDKCREFWWFVILAMIGGAVVYLLYLYLFRKNIREEHGNIESRSGEDAPKTPTDQAPPMV